MSAYFDKSKNLRDLADDIVTHLNRTGGGHDVSNEPRVPKGSGPTSGEWTRGGGTHAGDTRTALKGVSRWLANQHRDDFKEILKALTNGALSVVQMDSLVDQVIDNLTDQEAKSLMPLAGADFPTIVTPVQMQVIQHQIDQLSPDIRDTVQKAFDQSVASGTITCPKCGLRTYALAHMDILAPSRHHAARASYDYCRLLRLS